MEVQVGATLFATYSTRDWLLGLRRGALCFLSVVQQVKLSFLLVQLQEVLLSYIANPQLELALVMLIVPFIVNVSRALQWVWSVSPLQPQWHQSSVLSVHHVLGGGQPDDEEVQNDEEPGGLLRRLGEEGRVAALVERRGDAGEHSWHLYVRQPESSPKMTPKLPVFAPWWLVPVSLIFSSILSHWGMFKCSWLVWF